MRLSSFRSSGAFAIVLLACAPRGSGPSSGPAETVPPPSNPFRCLQMGPFHGDSGYEQCQRGRIHRARKGICPTTLPRPDYTAAEDRRSYYSCRRDSDCADGGPHRYCDYQKGGLAPSGYSCVNGCIDDSECGPGHICLCNGIAGGCYEADCTSDSDCSPGFLCASFTVGCFGTTIQFGCQSPGDECGDDADCGSGRFCGRTAVGVTPTGPRRCQAVTCTD